MLLVLVFYMGIEDGGKKKVERRMTVTNQAQNLINFQPTRDRWADRELQRKMLNGEIMMDENDNNFDDEYGVEEDNGKPAMKFSGKKPTMNQLLKGCDEIQWWLNRAISYVKPFLGEVTRYVQID